MGNLQLTILVLGLILNVISRSHAMVGPFKSDSGMKRFRIDSLLPTENGFDGEQLRERRSFYTTRFGKRSDTDSEQNGDVTEPTIPEPVQENNPPPRSSFYTTRFGRRSDPSWNAKFLKLHQQQLYQQQQQQLPLQQPKWDQDDLSEGQSAADNYIKNGQPLLNDHIKCHFLWPQNPLICQFGDGISEVTLAMNDDQF